MNPKISKNLDREFADSTSVDLRYNKATQELVVSLIDYHQKKNVLHFIKCLDLELSHPLKEIESKNPFIDMTGIVDIIEISTKDKTKEFRIQFICNSIIAVKCLDFYYEYYE
jgi:hypothetical protein